MASVWFVALAPALDTNRKAMTMMPSCQASAAIAGVVSTFTVTALPKMRH